MDSNWIFDSSGQASTATMSSNNNSHATPPPQSSTNGATATYTPSQTNAFLNFDSPSNQSDSHQPHNSSSTAGHGTNFNGANNLDYLDPTHHLKKDEWTQITDFSDIDMNFFHGDSNGQVSEENQILMDPTTINENEVNGNHASIRQLHNQHLMLIIILIV